MNLSPHLTLEEFTASQTAARQGIDNRLPPELVANARQHALGVFEPVREIYGRPLIVSSGYRCAELNAAVGGAEDSHHVLALATDLTCPSTPLMGFFLGIVSRIDFIPIDELIYEFGAWAHVQSARPGSLPRRRVLMKFRGTGYLPFDLDEAKRLTPSQT